MLSDGPILQSFEKQKAVLGEPPPLSPLSDLGHAHSDSHPKADLCLEVGGKWTAFTALYQEAQCKCFYEVRAPPTVKW